jgi:hypothetical protein
MALNALNGGRSTIKQVAERTGQEPHKSGAALYRLERQGRVRRAGSDPQTRETLFERVPGGEQAEVRAVIRVPRTTTIERMLELLGRLEQETKAEREELGRLREENTRLRKAMKELAAKL